MNRNLEADVNHQEDEDEEEEAVWLREQGHCKNDISQGEEGCHLSQGPTIGRRGNRQERRSGRATGMCVTVRKGAGMDHWADHRRVQE